MRKIQETKEADLFYTSNNLPFAILDLSSMRIQRWFRQHLLRRQYLRKRSGLYGLMHTERRKRDSGYDCSFYLLVSICFDRECPIVSNYVLQLLTSNTFGMNHFYPSISLEIGSDPDPKDMAAVILS